MHVYKPRGELTMKEKGTCSFYPSLEVHKNPSIQHIMGNIKQMKFHCNIISLSKFLFFLTNKGMKYESLGL